MARNLFVCHTQAQLILASGLVLGRFKDDENCLFLFPDFALGADLKTRLEIIFSKVIYLQSIYPPQYNTYWSKIFNPHPSSTLTPLPIFFTQVTDLPFDSYTISISDTSIKSPSSFLKAIIAPLIL